jgi:hypothetical protein
MSKAKDDPKDDAKLADRDPINDPALDERERDRINAERLEAKFHGYTPLQAERILKERDQPQPEVPEDLDPQRAEAADAEAKARLEDPVAQQKKVDEARKAEEDEREHQKHK